MCIRLCGRGGALCLFPEFPGLAPLYLCGEAASSPTLRKKRQVPKVGFLYWRPFLELESSITLSLSFLYHLSISFLAIMSSNSQAKSNGYTQHKTVLAPPKAIESSRIPKPGPIAIVPTDTFLAGAALNYIKKELSDIEGLELQIDQQQVNEETRGIIWLDNSPGQMNLLDNLLQKHKEISWVQLPMAGINAYASLLKKFPNIIWTSAKVSSHERLYKIW